MQLLVFCPLILFLLTASGRRVKRVKGNGVKEIPHKKIQIVPDKDDVGDMMNTADPMSIGSGIDNEGGRNVIRSVSTHLKHWKHGDLQHIIDKFDTQCQTDVKTMDSYCSELLEKLKHRIKIRLELPELQRRQMNSTVFVCGLARPFALKLYDPSQEVCCNGKIHPKDTGMEMCCGNKNRTIYDKTKHLCCNGTPYRKTRFHQGCCGRNVYDKLSQKACCNDQIYDTKRKFCCDGKTLHHNIGRQNRNGKCCGEEKFDDRCYTCGNVTKIISLFNPVSQRCCHGHIKVIKDNKTVCCGNQLMDASKYECKENIIIKNDRASLSTQNVSLRMNVRERTFKVRPDSNDFGESFKVVTSGNTSQPISLGALLGISIAVMGVIVIAPVIVCLYKRELQRKTRQPDISLIHTCINNATETNPGSVTFSNTNCENGCESGYNSLQNTQTFNTCLTTENSENRSKSQDGAAQAIIDIGQGREDLTALREVTDIFEGDIPKISTHYEKFVRSHNTNLTSELFSDAETQTKNPKENNQRDIFGNVYQHSQYLDIFNTTVKWDKSDSKLTIPASAITEHKLFVQASSFDNIPAIYKKFRLTGDMRLASPVVEYCFTGCKSLKEHALVELPILSGDMSVYKFCSDGGIRQRSELEPIKDLEEEDFSYDTFCIIKREKVLIYTKTFSGFMCINHGTRQKFSLKAFLFASYKKVMQSPEVRLNLYIADELHNFTDYNQRMFSNEECEGREKCAEKPLDLPECEELNGEDILELIAIVQSDVADEWEHKLHPRENRPIEKELKVVKLKNLSRCCQSENSLPYPVAWYLINKGRVSPSPVVQVVVDVTCKLIDQRAESTLTTLVIDELKIRDSDRTEVLTDRQRVIGLKQFLTQFIEPSKRESLLTHLNDFVRRQDPGIAHSHNLMDILTIMERALNATDFVSAISNILHQIKEFGILDILVNSKLIPGHLLQNPVQPQHSYTSSRTAGIGGASKMPSQGFSVTEPSPFGNGTFASDYGPSAIGYEPPTFGDEPSSDGNESHAGGTFSQGNCRPEMNTINTCSYDNNHEGSLGPSAQVSRPRPELQNIPNELSVLGLRPVIDEIVQQDTTSTDLDTEQIILE